MWINKKVIAATLFIVTFLTVLYVSTITTYHMGGKGNPFGLYGDGNCTYFAYECTELYWPTTFNIPRSYDACEWLKCIGMESNGYVLTETVDPEPGDLFVVPATSRNKYGHVGMITGVYWTYSLEDGRNELNYTVIESNMYATEEKYPLTYRGCRYRQRDCQADYLNAVGAVFLTCSLNSQNNPK